MLFISPCYSRNRDRRSQWKKLGAISLHSRVLHLHFCISHVFAGLRLHLIISSSRSLTLSLAVVILIYSVGLLVSECSGCRSSRWWIVPWRTCLDDSSQEEIRGSVYSLFALRQVVMLYSTGILLLISVTKLVFSRAWLVERKMYDCSWAFLGHI